MSHHDHKGPKPHKHGPHEHLAYRLMQDIMKAELRHADPKHVADHEGEQLADRAYQLTLMTECVKATQPLPPTPPKRPA